MTLNSRAKDHTAIAAAKVLQCQNRWKEEFPVQTVDLRCHLVGREFEYLRDYRGPLTRGGRGS